MNQFPLVLLKQSWIGLSWRFSLKPAVWGIFLRAMLVKHMRSFHHGFRWTLTVLSCHFLLLDKHKVSGMAEKPSQPPILDWTLKDFQGGNYSIHMKSYYIKGRDWCWQPNNNHNKPTMWGWPIYMFIPWLGSIPLFPTSTVPLHECRSPSFESFRASSVYQARIVSCRADFGSRSLCL